MKTKTYSLKKFFLLVLITLAFVNITDAQISVVKVENLQLDNNPQGIFYSLPQTYLTFDINFDITIQKRGPYYQYAKKYLGLDNVVMQDSDKYEIGEIFISSFNRPDPEQYYFVEYNERSKKDELSLLLSLNESGYISGVNEMTTIEKTENKILEQTDNKEFSKELFKYFAEDNLYKKIDTIIRKINISDY